MWFQTLQFCSQSLGGWRKRRKGLANIMIDPNLVATPNSIQNQQTNDAEESVIPETTFESAEKNASWKIPLDVSILTN